MGSATSAATALSGDVFSDVNFVADEAADENVSLGTVLTVATADHVNGLSDTCTVHSAPDISVPAGSVVSYLGLDSATYYATTQEDVAIGDSGSASVEVLSTVADENGQMTVGSGGTLIDPPTDVSATVGVEEVMPAKFFPLEDATRTYGAAITLTGRVKRETDGRYSAIVFTSPLGT